MTVNPACTITTAHDAHPVPRDGWPDGWCPGFRSDGETLNPGADDSGSAPVERNGSWWRTGSKVGRTLYLCHPDTPDGVLVGVMDTRELAARVVDALNGPADRPESAVTPPAEPGAGEGLCGQPDPNPQPDRPDRLCWRELPCPVHTADDTPLGRAIAACCTPEELARVKATADRIWREWEREWQAEEDPTDRPEDTVTDRLSEDLRAATERFARTTQSAEEGAAALARALGPDRTADRPESAVTPPAEPGAGDSTHEHVCDRDGEHFGHECVCGFGWDDGRWREEGESCNARPGPDDAPAVDDLEREADAASDTAAELEREAFGDSTPHWDREAIEALIAKLESPPPDDDRALWNPDMAGDVRNLLAERDALKFEVKRRKVTSARLEHRLGTARRDAAADALDAARGWLPETCAPIVKKALAMFAREVRAGTRTIPTTAEETNSDG